MCVVMAWGMGRKPQISEVLVACCDGRIQLPELPQLGSDGSREMYVALKAFVLAYDCWMGEDGRWIMGD